MVSKHHTTDPVKSRGAIYTPEHIARRLIEQAGLLSPDALANAVICEPAAGDGAILRPLVETVLDTLPKHQAIPVLSRMVAFDTDLDALNQCAASLDHLLYQRHPDARVDWQLVNIDATAPATTRPYLRRFTHVIGNPPYVRVQNLGDRRSAISKRWMTASGSTDLYIVFFEIGLSLLQSGGTLVYITPNGWLTNQAGRDLRHLLTRRHRVSSIIDHRHHQAFPEAASYTAITTIVRDQKPDLIPVFHHDGSTQPVEGNPHGFIKPDAHQPNRPWMAPSPQQSLRLQEMTSRGIPLHRVADIIVGIQTMADDVFITSDPTRIAQLEDHALRPIVKASQMQHGIDAEERRIIFPYTTDGRLIPEDDFAGSAPLAYNHLLERKNRLTARDRGDGPAERWYAFGRNVSITAGFADKIITPSLSDMPNFQRHNRPDATFYSGYAVKPRAGLDPDLLAQALNSPEMELHIDLISRPYSSGWMSYAKSYIKDFPVPADIIPPHLKPRTLF